MAPYIHRRAFAATLLLLVTLMLAGCTSPRQWLRNGLKVGPEYCPPPAPVANQWIDFNDRKVISEPIHDVNWWHVFNDPVINNLVQHTTSQNLPLRASLLRIEQARLQRAIAVGSFFPQSQDAFAQYQRIQLSRNGNPAGINTAALPFRALDVWTTGFNLAWEADLWGKFRRGIESADASLEGSVFESDDVLVCLISETVAAYVEIRAFQQRIKYADDNIKIQDEYLRLAQVRFDEGEVSSLDVTEARSRLRETESLVPAFEAGMRQANNRLCILLGIPPRDLVPELGNGPIPSVPPEVAVGVPAELIRRRPDVRKAEREVAAQSARIGIAEAELYPAFTISGTLNWQASSFSDMFEQAAMAGVIAPQFRWNILNYGRIINNVHLQDAKFHETVLQYQQTVLTANAESEDAIIAFLKSQQEVLSLEQSVEDTLKSVDTTRTQYREGAVPFDRVNNQLRDLVPRQDRLAISEAEIALSLIRLYKSLGGGWEVGPPTQVMQALPQEQPFNGMGMEHLPAPQSAPAARLPSFNPRMATDTGRYPLPASNESSEPRVGYSYPRQ